MPPLFFVDTSERAVEQDASDVRTIVVSVCDPYFWTYSVTFDGSENRKLSAWL